MQVAGQPESVGPAEPVDPVHAVGIGPGAPAFLTERARGLLADADLVVGFETVLASVAEATDAKRLSCGYGNQTEQIETFAAAVADGADGIAALMGDPNVSGYQFLGRVERAVERPVRVVPGISAIQMAASRARTPLEESTVVTLHRRGPLDEALDRLAADVGERHLLVIPHPTDWMPEAVAAHLLDRGADPSLRAFVFEHLTQDGESHTATTLEDLARGGTRTATDGSDDGDPSNSAFSDVSVLVVRADSRAPRSTEVHGDD